jgi:uncharacterized protein with FMN-binding domain
MPKRGAFALVMTALAVVLLLGFRTPEDIAAITGGDQRAGVTGAAGTTGATIDGAAGNSGATGSSGAAGTNGGTTGGAGANGGTAGGAGTGANGGTAQTQDRTVTGPVVSTRFGTVQVAITVEGGQLTDVTALQLPTDDRRSASISSRVEPTLRSQALTAQSAAIDGVSGATYTSAAYARSLQAALDSAGL